MEINLGGGASVFIIMLAAFVLGGSLARLNVFAASVATAISAAGAFLYGISSDFTPAHSLWISFGSAIALQAGYLAGLVFRRHSKDGAEEKPDA